jgi:serine/threonine protein kinase
LKEETIEFDINDLINEAICLNSINHPNVIKFYGVVYTEMDKKYKYLVFEYMNMGDLLSYLRNISKRYRVIKIKSIFN